jgi:hypothetical protein
VCGCVCACACARARVPPPITPHKTPHKAAEIAAGRSVSASVTHRPPPTLTCRCVLCVACPCRQGLGPPLVGLVCLLLLLFAAVLPSILNEWGRDGGQVRISIPIRLALAATHSLLLYLATAVRALDREVGVWITLLGVD